MSLKPTARRSAADGWKGWDDYADFYDWENAQTLDRRDVRFWQDMAQRVMQRRQPIVSPPVESDHLSFRMMNNE